jgi:diguanylate cyclase (GGDEF)-like protein
MDYYAKRFKPFVPFLGFFLVLAIGSLDSFANYDVSVAVLYLLPVLLIAWFEGVAPAVLIAIFSSVTWAISDLASGHIYSHMACPVWNAVLVLVMFLAVACSVTALKRFLIKERERAGLNDVTGAANNGSFYEQARAEISRAAIRNRPLTLAYIRIDDLRRVHSNFGRIAGEHLLYETTQILRSTLRATDIISRQGADKFAILMPETKKENAAVIIAAVRERLLAMAKKNGWLVTCSTIVVACHGPECTIDELIRKAEEPGNAFRETDADLAKYEKLD